MPILIGAFALGPVAGVLTELVKVLLNLVVNGTQTAFVGEFANFVMGCMFVLPASLIYKMKKSRKHAVIGLAAGTVTMSVAAVFIKLIGFCALFLPAAVALGFRESELVAILVMLGSATTVSCFVMAKNMGHEGVLTSSVVMLTTLFSGFTLTGWIYLLRSFALI